MALTQQLLFATLNVRGLRSLQKQAQLRRLLSRHRLDFVAVQETKIESDDETERALRPFLSEYNVCVSHALGLSAGCFLFLKKSLLCSAFSYHVDAEGRYIYCDFVLQGVPWRIVNLYAFNDAAKRILLFDTVSNLLDCERCIVLMGDFNCVCDPSDRSGINIQRDRSGEVLSNVIENAGLIDIGASGQGSCSYTRIQGHSYARLDRIYVSSSLLSRGLSCSTIPVSFSDHCMVIAKIGEKSVTNFRPQWALWKLNSELLNDQEFINRVRMALTTCFSTDLPLFAAW